MLPEGRRKYSTTSSWRKGSSGADGGAAAGLPTGPGLLPAPGSVQFCKVSGRTDWSLSHFLVTCGCTEWFKVHVCLFMLKSIVSDIKLEF